MNYNMAEDAIKDAIANRRLAKQPHDAGLEEALEIILTPITELPDVQRLIIQTHQTHQLQQKITRVEQLKEHYKSIGFNDTAKRIEQALKG